MSSSSAEPRHTISALIRGLPPSCYDNPVWKGLLYFTRDVAIYAALLAALVLTDHPLALLVLWPLTGFAISGLFVLGHDAAHGALFTSRRLCGIVGRLAMLPSLHGFDVWILGHNRIHHVHTGCEGRDFVWHPVTKAQYDALTALQRLVHRIEWSVGGAGLYYLRAVWWERMIRLTPPDRYRAGFDRDRVLVYAFAAAFSAALIAGGWAHYGRLAGGAWMWTKVFALPWLCWNHTIGVTVYVHHIGPHCVWRSRDAWQRVAAQTETTTNLIVPRWYNVFAHNIYWHVPHHVDPRIPFYNLPQAAAALGATLGTTPYAVRLRLRDYVRTTRTCKLYDFARETWCGYDGVAVSTARRHAAVPAARERRCDHATDSAAPVARAAPRNMPRPYV